MMKIQLYQWYIFQYQILIFWLIISISWPTYSKKEWNQTKLKRISKQPKPKYYINTKKHTYIKHIAFSIHCTTHFFIHAHFDIEPTDGVQIEHKNTTIFKTTIFFQHENYYNTDPHKCNSKFQRFIEIQWSLNGNLSIIPRGCKRTRVIADIINLAIFRRPPLFDKAVLKPIRKCR